MITYNLIDDISTLSGIYKSQLNDLSQKAISIVGQDIFDASKVGDSCQINIGIGNLIVDKIDGDIVFKFIPAQQLEDCILNSISNDAGPVQSRLEQLVDQRMLHLYKELF